MAKLENVKILESTRVEYNGAVYEKTEEKAKEGDLVRVLKDNPHISEKDVELIVPVEQRFDLAAKGARQ